MNIKHLALQDGCQALTGTTDPKRGPGKLAPAPSTIFLQTSAILVRTASFKGFTLVTQTSESATVKDYLIG